jgi:hypothetical protein
MNTTRRSPVKFAVTASLVMSMGAAWAAQPLVEIIAFGQRI